MVSPPQPLGSLPASLFWDLVFVNGSFLFLFFLKNRMPGVEPTEMAAVTALHRLGDVKRCWRGDISAARALPSATFCQRKQAFFGETPIPLQWLTWPAGALLLAFLHSSMDGFMSLISIHPVSNPPILTRIAGAQEPIPAFFGVSAGYTLNIDKEPFALRITSRDNIACSTRHLRIVHVYKSYCLLIVSPPPMFSFHQSFLLSDTCARTWTWTQGGSYFWINWLSLINFLTRVSCLSWLFATYFLNHSL